MSFGKGIVHPYYVSAIGPGAAAMVGAGAMASSRRKATPATSRPGADRSGRHGRRAADTARVRTPLHALALPSDDRRRRDQRGCVAALCSSGTSGDGSDALPAADRSRRVCGHHVGIRGGGHVPGRRAPRCRLGRPTGRRSICAARDQGADRLRHYAPSRHALGRADRGLSTAAPAILLGYDSARWAATAATTRRSTVPASHDWSNRVGALCGARGRVCRTRRQCGHERRDRGLRGDSRRRAGSRDR